MGPSLRVPVWQLGVCNSPVVVIVRTECGRMATILVIIPNHRGGCATLMLLLLRLLILL